MTQLGIILTTWLKRFTDNENTIGETKQTSKVKKLTKFKIISSHYDYTNKQSSWCYKLTIVTHNN